ncbi:hypothetical protein QTJ16_000696 [Diplocarpon rosae]|uniref:Nucleolar 27S pre-rRNA processing Urb2/Npa2 C-terminal domain-containing protein n=1 Tax=Diplocarpon rosae TaxID=946125 RepID=A0AAD9T657_9HELO|nr:hypothetical protein QTJ16_000696 [Diplocarpon rosae]
MMSKSRAAQERLALLEKKAAPFEDQLVEAAKFVEIGLDAVQKSVDHISEGDCGQKSAIYHGKEQWSLRWLLKRLQAPGDNVPRSTASSWRLLSYLVRVIPITIAARILVERQFISIIRQTLEEAQKFGKYVTAMESASESSATEQETVKVSKKRRRTGELVTKPNGQEAGALPDLLNALYLALNTVVQYTKPLATPIEDERSTEFSAEYMKSVLRTSAEEAAAVLGLWLSLCHSALPLAKTPTSIGSWLSPFIEVWNLHTTGDNPHLQFSVHSTRPLLLLLGSLKGGLILANVPTWVGQLEKLVAQNIVLPSKADTGLLETLTQAFVLQNNENGPLLFEVAVRSVQPTRSARRRKAQDDKFLQNFFSSLKGSMFKAKGDYGRQMCAILKLAIDHKLGLDLAILRSIADATKSDWDITANLLKLDANVFLVPGEDGYDLLESLFEAISRLSTSESWPDNRDKIIATVVVPLIRAFSKARDLSGFIRQWFSQLVRCHHLIKDIDNDWCAWEDDDLLLEFASLMEANLEPAQLLKILEDLKSEFASHPNAACVILDAIAGAISGDERWVDNVLSQLHRFLFSNGTKLEDRYRWRSWRIVSHATSWLDHGHIEEFSTLWENQATPLDSICKFSAAKSVFGRKKGGLESLEVFRFACSAWTARQREMGSRLETLGKPILLAFFRTLARDVKKFSDDLLKDEDLGDEICGSKQNALKRGNGWLVWSFIRCLFVDNPRVLVLLLESEKVALEEMLQHIFWISSASYPENNSNPTSKWLQRNPTAFPDLWRLALRGGASVLKSDAPENPDNPVFSHRGLLKTFVSTMINNETNLLNPLMRTPGNNKFAIRSLLELTVEEIPKEYRGRLMSCWLPRSDDSDSRNLNGLSFSSTILHEDVLALKRKIMRMPKLHEGMKFQELIDLADALAEAEIPDRFHHLASLKELARLIFVSALQDPDQPRSKTYISEAFKNIQKRVAKASEKKKHRPNFALVATFEVALKAFRDKATVLHQLDVIDKGVLDCVVTSFKACTLAQLKNILRSFEKGNDSDYMLVNSIIDGLSTLGVEGSELVGLEDDAVAYITSVGKTNVQFGERLQTFFVTHRAGDIDQSHLEGDVTESLYVLRSMTERANAALSGKNDQQKLELLREVLEKGELERLDKLLAAREIVKSISDTRRGQDEDDSENFDLTEAYNILATYLPQSTDIRQFYMVSETLELILRTKPRSISQYNIDATLGSISIFCSPESPDLYPTYLHLCALMRTVLTHHRIKLKGHFHLTQQTLQALLRCLFNPLPYSTAKSARFNPRPTWLLPRGRQLGAREAEAFSRLLLSISDPTVSAVQGHSSTLTSEKDKAKRISSQYMKFVLEDYIRGQLEMKMLPEVRETLMPGLYAILNTISKDTRDAISSELDGSGRAVFMRLWSDWGKFEKSRG